MTSRGPKAIQKIIIVGDSGVGKTSLMNRYVSSKFTSHYKATIGADFMPKEVVVDDMSVTLQIWDTAGQERFQSLGNAFYRGSDACVLVYDVTNPESFSRLFSLWRPEFVKRAGLTRPDDFPFIVMGNKCDVEADKITVPEARAKEVCAEHGVPHFRVSAKEGRNVDQAFLTVVKAALKRPRVEAPIPDSLDLHTAPPPKEDSCPC